MILGEFEKPRRRSRTSFGDLPPTFNVGATWTPGADEPAPVAVPPHPVDQRWLKDPFVLQINAQDPYVLTGRMEIKDDVTKIFNAIRQNAIVFGLASKNTYQDQLNLQNYAVNLTQAMAQLRYPDQAMQDTFYNTWYRYVAAKLAEVAAIPQLKIINVMKKPVTRQAAAPAPQSAGVPTWVYIAGGVAVLGIAGYFVMHKK
jgi:hypothetical protein